MSSETAARKKRPTTDTNPAPEGDHRKRYLTHSLKEVGLLTPPAITDVGTGQLNHASIATPQNEW